MPPPACDGERRPQWPVRSTLRKEDPIAVTDLSQYQRLVAALLIDSSARALYVKDVTRFRRAYPLYPVTDGLQFTASSGFDVSAGIIRFRRLQSILACLPATLELLNRAFLLDDVIAAFHERWRPLPFTPGTSRALAEGRRFTLFLKDHDSLLTLPYLHDLARYECLRMEVLLRPRHASDDDDRFEARDRPTAAGEDAPTLSSSVAIETFDYHLPDLVRPGATAPRMAPRRSCSLLLQRTRGGECRVWPLGRLASDILRLCDGTRTIGEIATALDPNVLDPEKRCSDQILQVLNAARARCLLEWSPRSR